MGVTRNVHKIEASLRDGGVWGTWTSGPGGAGMVRKEAPKLANELNRRLAPNERIVGTVYEDGYWVIITETYGLGPPTGV